MTAYVVAFDVHGDDQAYDAITQKLMSYGTYWRIQDSLWMTTSNWDSVRIRKDLISCIAANDILFIAELGGGAAWNGFTAEEDQWLKQVLG